MKPILYVYPEIWGLRSLSPFCIKVYVFMKYHQIDFDVKVINNPAKGPRNKLPYIFLEDKVYPDSNLIIEKLISVYKIKDYLNVIPEEQVYMDMIEDSFYFNLMYARWVDNDSYKIVKKEFGNLFLPGYGQYFMNIIRRSLLKQAYMQGVGRLSAEEVYNKAGNQLGAIERKLQGQQFLFGDKISITDFSLYSFLVTINKSPLKTVLHQKVKSNLCFLQYIDRIEAYANIN